MKLLITGSRKATFEADYEALKKAIETHAPNVSEILHGGAKGIDSLAQKYAIEKGLPTTIIKPDYEQHPGKLAPLIRNSALVGLCDGCIAYYKGSQTGGTLDTAKKAQKAGKLLVEIIDGQAKTTTQQLGLF